MNINKKQVFLISGQKRTVSGTEVSLAEEISQCVVLAEDSAAAFALLREKDESFHPLGQATLEDYESAAAKLRLALKGGDVGMPVYVSLALAG